MFPILKLSLVGVLLGFSACASSKPASYDAERSRARAGYDKLNAETGSGPSSSDRYSNQSTAYSGSGSYSGLAEIDFPKPILMALPANSGKGSSPASVVANNPFARAAMEGVNEYLTEKGYEVRSLEGNEDLGNLIQMQGDISENGDDMSYVAGLALGADVYIKFSGYVKNHMVTVELSAYETSTARLLGSKTGTVQDHGSRSENQRYLVHSAAKKALPALEKTIQSYWREDWKKGIQYKVVMRIGEQFSGSNLEELQDQAVSSLRKVFKSVRVNSMTDKTIDLIVYASPSDFPDAHSVYFAIRENLAHVAQAKKNNITNKLVILELN